ncbi:hypothetical protein CcrKarma_gp064 [Caulobacter virus Karma]|jgi:hypothetical protein|uniref:Uncharacterized protein n=6 Tax=Viruses TaxID=10239 RepID=K4JRJ0_9CAUD|nr:hypothetical protein D865_gp063 [Caulobacter phage phiCbK]YP_006988743.1 hypothetical protein CcrMagneto_gp061 [Caulobacter virus Magneto]YP_006989444.1 hypothetical protein CcrKarma_gp064 [Caulobacter virus Karma]YP_006989794.1 hypothetical protein D870_gp061 [Caulobacter phage CcrSwift]ARB13591.1 hypothetical protein Ccr10_gp063 [Caulobacter phage Ccr10]ARB13937.1 hypothetical protein Ccr2_gp062 [Caulobacter phage Ccr2]ARB14280.1 hypothetical protein Ccr5_gp062 [Caulobacter phage Ccr5]A
MQQPETITVDVQPAEVPAPKPRPRAKVHEPQRFNTFKAALFGTTSLIQITRYAG